jgi:hypothetical protein
MVAFFRSSILLTGWGPWGVGVFSRVGAGTVGAAVGEDGGDPEQAARIKATIRSIVALFRNMLISFLLFWD